MKPTDSRNDSQKILQGDLFAAAPAGVAAQATPDPAAELELIARRKKAPKRLKATEDEPAVSAAPADDGALASGSGDAAESSPFVTAAAGEPLRFAQADTGTRTDAGPDTPAAEPRGGAGGAAAAAAGGGINTAAVLGGVVLLGAAAAGGGGGGGGGSSPAPAPTDTTAPTVSAVAITGATGAQNHTLNAGDTVTVTVTMSESVTVTGTPQLALNIGGTTVQANYASGSGTDTLTFTYTIQAGQTDTNGISIDANSLSLNGGSIRDTAGNNAALGHAAVADNASYLVDTTAPTAPVIDPVSTDNVISASEANSTVITGTAEANATITLTLGTATRTVTANASGVWTYSVTSADITAMGQGAETIRATATDTAGNVSGAGIRNITVATEGVPAPTLELANDAGSSNSDGITNIATINVTGLVTGATWEYRIDGGAWTTGTGTSFNATAGQHTYEARQSDGSNTSAISTTLNVTLDTTPPSAPTIALASDTGTSNSDGITNNGTINVTGLETGAAWQYQVDDGAWTAGTGTSFTATAGSHTYAVRQTDVAGNNSAASAAITVNLDTAAAAPALALATDTGTSNSDGITNNDTINVTGLETGAGWQYQVDGGAWTAGTGTSFTATAGTHTYAVRQTDVAGNNSAASAAITVNLDNTPPNAPTIALATDTGTSNSDGITNNDTINVTGLETGAAWQYQVDGGAWTAGTGTSFTATAGSHTYAVRQTDLAGNTGPESGSLSVNYDTVAPTCLISDDTAGTADGPVTFTFTFSEAVTGFTADDVTVTNGAKGTLTHVGVNGSGQDIYTMVITPVGASGTMVVDVTTSNFSDLAGNANTVDTAADSQPFVDTTDPAFSSGATAYTLENVPTWFPVYDATADNDVGVTYTLSGTDAGLFDIDATTGWVTFKTSPNFEAPADNGANNVYDFTVTATDGAGRTATRTVALTVGDVGDATHAEVITLANGWKLIQPVNVDGNWYYFVDKNGDGSPDAPGFTNDTFTHNQLDLLFNQNLARATNPDTTGLGTGTTDAYRYTAPIAITSGGTGTVRLALPTIGDSDPSEDWRDGTAASGMGGTNTTYDDLLAIWDAFNGTGTASGEPNGLPGLPPGWGANPSYPSTWGYWSATPAGSSGDHLGLNMYYGYVNGGFGEDSGRYVAVQVL